MKKTQEELDNFMLRVEKLTGKNWVPYPHDFFIDVCNNVDDELFIQLIEKRRTYRATSMVCSQEPMCDILREIANNNYK